VVDVCRKKLQGPPSEFAQHTIPQPELAALTSDSAWYDLMFTKADDGTFVWKGEVVVDSQEELDISIFSPYEDKLDIIVQPPNELPFSLKLAIATRDLMARRHFEGISAPYELSFTSVRASFSLVPCQCLSPSLSLSLVWLHDAQLTRATRPHQSTGDWSVRY
jgi:hypothetical protein